ncbi:MAG: Addiction module antitoxin, RelB/DinJ family [Candidatus Nomurabacteria bacterium GW2011_GWB1_37_5]|uniref:Addiction module antitoxin, RelB/DinJ family n=1 Tax=Candidatus Nomurabacteria bacterium GW2011_GWB1_37_5 TaxID=1618742 RepID=A0A0G0K5B9_9BACT|nr:MAG: Addiction module antitoxin, RelB/DinJ family [Candidatus Nomurabacteria bacterium GW2011_GWB1_37_5]
MNTTIQIRIDQKTKDRAQKTFKNMGIDMSAGLKMFLNQVVTDNCLPFVPSTPKTRAIRKQMDREVAYALKHSKGYTSTKEMFDAIMARK